MKVAPPIQNQIDSSEANFMPLNDEKSDLIHMRSSFGAAAAPAGEFARLSFDIGVHRRSRGPTLIG